MKRRKKVKTITLSPHVAKELEAFSAESGIPGSVFIEQLLQERLFGNSTAVGSLGKQPEPEPEPKPKPAEQPKPVEPKPEPKQVEQPKFDKSKMTR
jgi:outer membrane biosynthesis protein TonB